MVQPHIQKLLEDRYYLRDEEGNLLETEPNQMFDRVAAAVAAAEVQDDLIDKWEPEFFALMADNKFLPNTPTLINAGKKQGVYAACNVLEIPDSMDGIFDTLKKAAIISKYGGGLGLYFGDLREEGSVVKSTGQTSSGPISFMQVFDAMCNTVKQGGCFTGDTKIATVHGPIAIKDLKEGELVYCWDGEYTLKPCTAPFKTIENAEIYKLRTDKGLVIKATKSHPIMRREGKSKNKKFFSKIEDLKPGMALMPFTRYQKKHHGVPEWNISLHDGCNTRIPEHLLVANAIGIIGECIHHKDENHLNNAPENLFGDTNSSHASNHGRKRYQSGNHPFLNLDEFHIEKRVSKFKSWYGNLSVDEKRELKRKNAMTNIASVAWTLINNGLSVKEEDWEFSIQTLPGNKRIKKDTALSYFIDWKVFESYLDNHNHKVESVVFSHYEDVYNVEVPEVHNYVVCNDDMTTGLVVSNSRRGAMLAALPVWHPDIEKFIACKDDGSFSNFNISVVITDDFMEAVSNDKDWLLHSPSLDRNIKPIKAKELWNKIVEHAHKTGDPGLIFIDEANRKHPLEQEIKCCNACGEQMLLHGESCVLGSINLMAYMVPNTEIGATSYWFDYDALEKDIPTMVRFLDDIIDASPYPLKVVEEATKASRKIGLGIMGWADCLIKMHIPYDSDEAIALAEQLAGLIYVNASKASILLGKEKGNYPLLPYGEGTRRNATVLTVAPTGTISRMCGVSSGIEPIFAWKIHHKLVDLEYDEEHWAWKDIHNQEAQYEGNVRIPRPEYLKTANEIAPEWHLKMQAAFQKHVDSSISKTINLPNDADVEIVEKIYMWAWKNKLKGITIYRDGSKDNQPLNKIKEEVKKEELQKLAHDTTGIFKDPEARPKVDGVTFVSPKVDFSSRSKEEQKAIIEQPSLDDMLKKQFKRRGPVTVGVTHKVDTGRGKIYITINYSEYHSEPVEVFIRLGHLATPTEAALAEYVGRLISLLLKNSVPINVIARQGNKVYADTTFWYNKQSFCSFPKLISHLLGFTFEEALDMAELDFESFLENGNEYYEENEYINTILGEYCYNCSTYSVVNEGHCKVCTNCGESVCG